MIFENNTYEYMMAETSGAVFDGSKYSFLRQEDNNRIHSHLFFNETISNTIGGAIVVKNTNNAGVTILMDCLFYNNFGTEGGSINIDEGGALIAINVNFSLSKDY